MKQARGFLFAGICARSPPALATSAHASEAFGCVPPGGLHCSVTVRSGEVPALVCSTRRDSRVTGLLLKNATGIDLTAPTRAALRFDVWLVLWSVASWFG